MQFRFMLFTEKQRITIKMLVITDYDIPGFKFTHKIWISAFLYPVDSIAYYTHNMPPQILIYRVHYSTIS